MEEDVIIIDDSGQQRNAVIVRRPGVVDNRGGLPAWNRPWNRPPFGHHAAPPPAYHPPVYHPPAPVYHPPAPVPAVYQPQAPTVTTVTTTPALNANVKSWIPDAIDILAAVMPLPAAPTATGDLAKDFNNTMAYLGSLAAAFKRADLMHTAARVVEKRL